MSFSHGKGSFLFLGLFPGDFVLTFGVAAESTTSSFLNRIWSESRAGPYPLSLELVVAS